MTTDAYKKTGLWVRSVLHSSGYDPKDLFYYITLLSAPVLLTAYRYFTAAQDFMFYFPNLELCDHGEVYACLLEYLSFFVLVLVIPLLLPGVLHRRTNGSVYQSHLDTVRLLVGRDSLQLCDEGIGPCLVIEADHLYGLQQQASPARPELGAIL